MDGGVGAMGMFEGERDEDVVRARGDGARVWATRVLSIEVIGRKVEHPEWVYGFLAGV